MEKIRMKKTLVILFSGRAGVGKTTAANILESYLDTRYKKLKTITLAVAIVLKAIARDLGWDGQKDLRGRTFLQKLGQTAREYDKDVWIKRLVYGIIEGHPYYPLDVVLIDDWRFPNEKDFIETLPLYDLVKVRIESPLRESLKGTPNYNEESELLLSEKPLDYFDYTIQNWGTMEEYTEQIKTLWEYILSNKQENMIWN